MNGSSLSSPDIIISDFGSFLVSLSIELEFNGKPMLGRASAVPRDLVFIEAFS